MVLDRILYMRLHELYQPLSEYIMMGSVEPVGTTYVFLYENKYAFQLQEPIRGTIDYIIAPQVIELALTYLADDERFEDSYASWKPALNPHHQEITALFFKTTKLKQELPEDISKMFFDILKKSTRILDDIASKIIYGLQVRTAKQAQAVLEKGVDNITKDYTVAVAPPHEYVVVDHDNQTIKRLDHSAKYNTRMRKYSGKTEYVLIRGDFSIDAKQFYKLVQDIKKEYPDYTVEEDTPQLSKAQEKLNTILSGRGKITAYHGTSNAIYTRIKKAGRMIPGLGPEYGDKFEGHSEKMIYLTLDPNVARRYGIRAAGAQPYVILEVTVNDISKLRFDEDSLNRAVANFSGSNRKVDLAVKRLFPDDWYDKDNQEFRVDWSNVYFMIQAYLKEGKIAFDGAEKVINYLLYKALVTMSEYSFAYEGQIPMSRVKVFEKSKTKKADPKDGDDVYTDVEQAAMRGQQ